jgi:hypothetical protein
VATSDEYRWQGWRDRVGLPVEPALTERCAYCDFTVSAALEQARQAFAEHECPRRGRRRL